MELVRHYSYSKTKANLSYYRDSIAKEIDIFIETNATVHPLEMKKSSNLGRGEINKFKALDKSILTCGNGGIVCMCEETVPIDGKTVL